MSATYPTPKNRRTALAPGLLGTISCLAGIAAVGGEVFTLIRFLVSILALIVGVFAWQAKTWWWLIPLAPIVILWNPVVPVELDREVWLAAHYIAALIFVATSLFIRIRNPEDRNRRN